MNSDGLTVMRLLLAAVNGALFALGLFILVEFLYRQPRRLKLRFRELVIRAVRTENLENKGDFRPGEPTSRELREQVDDIKDEMKARTRNPKFVINVAFGSLMILLAAYSLLSLLFPAWLSFT
ncbi:MAG TPA: hypothetical protein ENH10_03855 [Bacteroidetes bacterium]|nr:hypothetical protein BMS3Bbin04_01366 [bacterium BMS3Bbin04]HDO65152.1 hypothetical protein [Bacteroidota bacterium]HEX04277.1 hypothetical protein [Bacteroidota bacterium]